MYAKEPSDEELARNSLTRADLGLDDEILVLKDNWPAVSLFLEFSTQWRIGAAGPTGLDYGPIFTRMERLRLPDDDWQSLLSDLQILEATALAQMAEDQRESRRQ